ncbi:hypothetical protein [Salinivibrio sp. SS3]|uniref:hypothetical protein n=1 Tax=Salinivibrio sp. SS3 TaxID=1895021 RepID=UPI00159F0012|nr:hypothetical protein [Salinivibrio sp. BNH]
MKKRKSERGERRKKGERVKGKDGIGEKKRSNCARGNVESEKQQRRRKGKWRENA